ncbi:MAG: hypothetical protein ABUL68_03630 [Pseudomonadota bacterium]
MKAPRPSVKIGLVLLGLLAAYAVAWLAVDLRQRAYQEGPDAQTYGAMYAFGDLLLGIAVFGVFALVPAALALYWLRPVVWFWSILLWIAMAFASTGVFALAFIVRAGNSTGNGMLLAQARIFLMPLSALALLTISLFAPRTHHRWLLLAAAVTDGAIFGGIVLVKFILPRLAAG